MRAFATSAYDGQGAKALSLLVEGGGFAEMLYLHQEIQILSSVLVSAVVFVSDSPSLPKVDAAAKERG